MGGYAAMKRGGIVVMNLTWIPWTDAMDLCMASTIQDSVSMAGIFRAATQIKSAQLTPSPKKERGR